LLKAIDENNKRISPEKGKLGFCQLCRQSVRAYCGEINIHHWRHIEIQNCDTWNDGETEWHREWKNEFPDDWQEVIIEKDFEKHIADIKTPNNLVLELQNSSISSTTIKIREKFYGKMIWLINANEFKDNFRISSQVKTQLRYLEESHRSLIYYEPEDSLELKQANEELKDIEYDLRNLGYKVSNLKGKITEVKELLKEFKETTKTIFNKNYFYSSTLNDFNLAQKKEYLEIKESIKKIKEELQNKQNILTKINELENCKIENYSDYKYIKPDEVNSSSFSKCALIEKESEATFFPTILHFKSKTEFEQISKNQKYRLIVNPSEKLKKTKEEIIELKNNVGILLEKKSNTKKEIISQLKSFLKKNKKSFKEELNSIKEKKVKLKSAITLKKNQIESIQENESKEREEELISIEKHHKNERFEIMKKYKGLYNYNWKHKRKSWTFSEKKIYLDFENAIFEIINDNSLRKHKKSEFIETVKNWW
jgi:competence CoiA-like predicted nuclease